VAALDRLPVGRVRRDVRSDRRPSGGDTLGARARLRTRREATCALARDEYLAELQLAQDRGCLSHWQVFDTAIRHGQLGAVQWAHATGRWAWDPLTIMDAIDADQLAVLQWLLANGCPHDPKDLPSTCYCTARAGHLDVLKWLSVEAGFRIYSDWLLEVAQKHGHVAMYQWIEANRLLDPYSMASILARGRAADVAEGVARKKRKLLKRLHWGLSR
jgi:hypothetical protein